MTEQGPPPHYGPQPGFPPYPTPPTPPSSTATVGLTLVVMAILLLAIAASYFYVHDGTGGGSSTPRSPNQISQAGPLLHDGLGRGA